MTTTIHDDPDGVHIVTNNVPRPIIHVHYERGEGWVKAIDPGDDYQTSSGFEYRGEVYALQDFSITRGLPIDSPLRAFHGYRPITETEAIAYRLHFTLDDRVVVAHVHW